MTPLVDGIRRLLRKTEPYTKTDMVYLIGSGGWLTLAQGIASIGSLALAVGFANLLPPETYGQYRFILSFLGIIGAFSLSGLGSAVTQSVARGFEGTLKASFGFFMRFEIIIGIATGCVAAYYYSTHNMLFGHAFLMGSIFMPFVRGSELYSYFLFGKKRFALNAWYSALQSIVPTVLLLGALYVFDHLLIILAVYLIGNASVAYTLYRLSLRLVENDDIDQSSFRYGTHLSAMNVLGSIAAQLDKVLVFTYLGPLQLAVYSFAIAPPEQANHLRKIVRTLALPKLSTQTAEELKRFLPYKVWLGVLAMGGVVLGYYFIAPHFFALVLPQYIGSVWYSQVYALVLLFAPTIILHQALVAKKEQKALYVVNTAIPILKIALMFLLLPLYGVMGAIIGAIVTRGINTALLIYFFRSMR